jgi:HK97 gp10 family phage protein
MLRADVNSAQLQRVIGQVQGMKKDVQAKAELALNYHALNIESNAKKAVPVDTGVLQSSIKTEKLGSLGRAVHTNVEYAPYVEFGTREKVNTTISGVDYSEVAIQFKKSDGGPGGVPPRPYLFPAFEKEKKELLKSLRKITNGR